MTKSTNFTRRKFMGTTAGLITLPVFSTAMANFPSNPEVVIIGAGVAGTTAAKTLRAKGVDCVILEARDRIAGRAYTDTEIFGVPYDLGAAWLHSADENPVTDLINSVGFKTVDDESGDLWLYLDGEDASEDQYEAAEEAKEDLENIISRKIDRALDEGEKFNDVSVRKISPIKDRFDLIAHEQLGPLEAGADTDKLGAMDVYSQRASGVEWMVPQGLGAGIQKALGPQPVYLNTKVSKIDWGGKEDIKVETNKGSLRTKAVIITVPTDIIADGTIGFSPALPAWKVKAAEMLPMALLDKITLQFEDSFEEMMEGEELITAYVQNGENGHVWDHLMRPFDTNLSIGFLGGRFSKELATRPNADQIAIEMALESLEEIFGPEIHDIFIKGHYTKWSEDEFARGSYAAALPGGVPHREKLRQSIDDRLFFAGEATMAKWATQVSSAYLTGIKAANEAADAIK